MGTGEGWETGGVMEPIKKETLKAAGFGEAGPCIITIACTVEIDGQRKRWIHRAMPYSIFLEFSEDRVKQLVEAEMQEGFPHSRVVSIDEALPLR